MLKHKEHGRQRGTFVWGHMKAPLSVLPADSPADDGAPPVVAGYPRALPWVRVRVNDFKHI